MQPTVSPSWVKVAILTMAGPKFVYSLHKILFAYVSWYVHWHSVLHAHYKAMFLILYVERSSDLMKQLLSFLVNLLL